MSTHRRAYKIRWRKTFQDTRQHLCQLQSWKDMRVQWGADRTGQDRVMFADAVLRLGDFFFLFWNAGHQQTKTCRVSLKPEEWLLERWTQQVKAPRWRNVLVPGRGAMAQQPDACEGLRTPAAGGRRGSGRLFPWQPRFLLIKKLIIFLFANSA